MTADASGYCQVWLCALVLALAALPAAQGSDQSQLCASGQRIYETGEGLRAQLVGGLEITGESAACVQCHVDPRDGGLEGGVEIPPLAEISRLQPLNETSLKLALVEGLGVEGHALHVLMPRYRSLQASAVEALSCYLRDVPDIAGTTNKTITIGALVAEGGPHAPLADSIASSLLARVNELLPIHGRLITIDVIRYRTMEDLKVALERKPPLVVVGAVGILGDDASMEVLERTGIPALAPFGALTGLERTEFVFPARPTLLDQLFRLKEDARERHGCVRYFTAADADSIALAGRLGDGGEELCSAALLIGSVADSTRLAADLDGIADITEVLVALEQTGSLPGIELTYALGGRGTFSEQAIQNAESGMDWLVRALAQTGRTITRARFADSLRITAPDRAQMVILGQHPDN